MSAERPDAADIERALTELALASKLLGAEPGNAAAHTRVVRLHQYTLGLVQRYATQSYETGVDMGRRSALGNST